MKAGALAQRGIAVEWAVAQVLLGELAVGEARALAQQRYRDQMEELELPLDSKGVKAMQGIPKMVQWATDRLAYLGKPTGIQGQVSLELEGAVPLVGYYDFLWEDQGVLVDLKTTQAIPSDMGIAHCRQGAIYWAATGCRHEVVFAYTSPGRCDCLELQEPERYLQDVINLVGRMGQLLEHFGSLQELAQVLPPGSADYRWSDCISVRVELFGM